jgi:hypothetical protein
MIDGRIDDSGALIVSGLDYGPLVRTIFGLTDYEYTLRVDAAHVPQLLLLLLREHFTTPDRGFSESALRDWLARENVPAEWSTWHSGFHDD